MRSTIQRAPEAEDGEIVSSPEQDAADIEIKIHAHATSSEDSDIEETSVIVAAEPVLIEEEIVDLPTLDEIISIIDTPEEKSKSLPKNDFPQKEQPVQKTSSFCGP